MATSPTVLTSEGTDSGNQQDLQVLTDQERKQQILDSLKGTGPFGMGPNNERLQEDEPEVANTLKVLILQYRQEALLARRYEIRRVRQARLYWQGLQYNSFREGMFFQPFNQSLREDTVQVEGERYQYCTNYYQAYGLSFQSLLSQDVPTVKWFPESVQSEEDVMTAKAADKIVEIVEDNNCPQKLLEEVAYFLWNDGKIGSYTRFVPDGDEFGFKEVEEYGSDDVALGEETYTCPVCGAQTPANPAGIMPSCPSCGQPLTEEDKQTPPFIQAPKVTKTTKVAGGCEKINIIGSLELNTPILANHQHEMAYVQWEIEAHKAKLRYSYPHAATKIHQFGSLEDPEAVYARQARMTISQSLPIVHTGDALENYVTFTRTWIRPWAFEMVENPQTRAKLYKFFPDGCYCAFAGAYLESRNEHLDKKWVIRNAMPGDGQNRNAIGTSEIQVQERINIMSNIQMETYDYGIPSVFADNEVLDFDQLANTTAEPSAMYPVRPRSGQAVGNSFFVLQAAQVTRDFIENLQELQGPVSQFLTGMFPAVYGGSMDDVKTASAYAQARDQALGRLGMIWRTVKEFYCATMENAVDCFRESRPDDVEIPLLGAGGQFEAQWIRQADLRGKIHAKDEVSETFPRLMSQKKSTIMQLLQEKGDLTAEIAGIPDNMTRIKDVFGLQEFKLPGEDSRTKQLREISMMMQGIPVDIDPDYDDHTVEFGAVMTWVNSDPGQVVKIENPEAFELIRQHGLAHKMAGVMQAIQSGPPPQLPEEQGPEGKGNMEGEGPEGGVKPAKQVKPPAVEG